MEKKEFLTSLVPEPTEFTCNKCDKKFESLDNFTFTLRDPLMKSFC